MREHLLLWTFIFAIPALAILGHDLYIAYGNSEDKIEQLKDLDINPTDFAFSDVGRLWLGYTPGTLGMARDALSKDVWENYMAPFLEQKAIVIAVIPLVIFHILMALAWARETFFAKAHKVKKKRAQSEKPAYKSR